MPGNDDTATATDESTTSDRDAPAPLGTAEVVLDVSEEVYERAHREYCRAVDEGYPHGFDAFVFNNCDTDCYVTVDGEPVDPEVDVGAE